VYLNLREFTEVLKTYVLPESPPSFIMVIFLIGVVSMSFMGLETIARFAKFIIYILAAGYIIVLVLSFKNYVPSHLFPILGNGLDKTIINGLLRSSFYGDVMIVGIIAPFLHGPKEIGKIGYSGIFISGVVNSVSLLAYSLVFPYTTGQEITSPMYEMASLIDYSGFLQHLEPIFLFLWNFGSLIGIAILFHCSILIYCHIFRISDKRPVILPMATLVYCLSLIPKGMPDVTEQINILRTWGALFYFFPSIIILLIAMLRKKRGDSQNVQES
jgi:spore germination protein (amino acid permease)